MSNRIPKPPPIAETMAVLRGTEPRMKEWPWDAASDMDDEFSYDLTDDGWYDLMIAGRGEDGPKKKAVTATRVPHILVQPSDD